MLEGYIDGKYEKYMNNLTALDYDKESRHLTAFAHFSFERSNQTYLITDFQGVGVFLTDPTLHSKSNEFQQSGDFGPKGFIQFFSRHICNEICHKLNLEMPKLALKKGVKWEEKSFPHNSHVEVKCNANLCNNRLKKGDMLWCKFCKEFAEIVTKKVCKSCNKEFSSKPYVYFMFALNEPKKCDVCRTNLKLNLADLFDFEIPDDAEDLKDGEMNPPLKMMKASSRY